MDLPAGYYELQNMLLERCFNLARGCEQTKNVDEIKIIAKQMIIRMGCDPDCDCSICLELERNAWSEDYPNRDEIIERHHNLEMQTSASWQMKRIVPVEIFDMVGAEVGDDVSLRVFWDSNTIYEGIIGEKIE